MVNLEVCVGSACHLKGSYNVINRLNNIIEERKLGDSVVVKAAFCLGNCTQGVSVKVNNEKTVSVRESTVEEFLEQYIIPLVS